MRQSKRKQEEELELEVRRGKRRRTESVADESEWRESVEDQLQRMEDSMEWMEECLTELLVVVKGLGPRIDGARMDVLRAVHEVVDRMDEADADADADAGSEKEEGEKTGAEGDRMEE